MNCANECNFEGKVFIFSRNQANFQDAKIHCEQNGRTLAKNLNREAYAQLINCCTNNELFWIGLENSDTCRNGYHFKWIESSSCVSASPLYIQPLPRNNLCKAVAIHAIQISGRRTAPWSLVESCNSKNYFICEENGDTTSDETRAQQTRHLTSSLITSFSVALTTTKVVETSKTLTFENSQSPSPSFIDSNISTKETVLSTHSTSPTEKVIKAQTSTKLHEQDMISTAVNKIPDNFSLKSNFATDQSSSSAQLNSSQLGATISSVVGFNIILLFLLIMLYRKKKRNKNEMNKLTEKVAPTSHEVENYYSKLEPPNHYQNESQSCVPHLATDSDDYQTINDVPAESTYLKMSSATHVETINPYEKMYFEKRDQNNPEKDSVYVTMKSVA